MSLDWLRALGLLGFGTVIFLYHWNNKLILLVHPNYVELILGSATILALLGGYYFFRTLKTFLSANKRHASSHQNFHHDSHVHTHAHHSHVHTHAHQDHAHHGHAHTHTHQDHAHDTSTPHVHLFSESVSIGLLVVPILMALWITPQPLSSQTAVMRGVSYEMTGFQSQQKQQSFGVPPEKRSLIDWLLVLNLDPEPANYKNQSVNVQGMAIFHEDMPENHFMISQFVVSCCVADARPVGLLVQYDPNTQSVENGKWFQISGSIEEGQIKEQRQPVIALSEWQEIAPPETPYVSL